MEQSHESLEIFKLDEIDRKVFFWLIDHLGTRGLLSWVEYITQDYKRKHIEINPSKLLNEGSDLVNQAKITLALKRQRSAQEVARTTVDNL